SGRARPVLVKEPRVARAEQLQHRVYRLLEIVRRLRTDDWALMLVAHSSRVRFSSHEFCVDRRQHLVEDAASLRFAERAHWPAPVWFGAPACFTLAAPSPYASTPPQRLGTACGPYSFNI